MEQRTGAAPDQRNYSSHSSTLNKIDSNQELIAVYATE
jgi:hypothetical protein